MKTSVNTYITPKFSIFKKKHNHTKQDSKYFLPTELAKIYQIPKQNNKRVNVAIIELGGGYKDKDLANYWKHLGLTTTPNIIPISVDGAKNNPADVDSSTEVVLDIEIFGGICPNSNIYVYFAPNTDKGFYDAIYAAINNSKYSVSVISISWGGPESSWDEKTLHSFNDLFKQAASKGITICTASGDDGSSDGQPGNNVDFPASSPWVLACGGTRLSCPTKIYDNSTKEIVWGTITGGGAAGGGISKYFDKPEYQSKVTSNINTKYRCVPDVCGNADPATGWLIYQNKSFYVVGGTSAVSPMWSAYLCSINYKKFLNPVLYDLYQLNKSIVHDILIGNEGSYQATKNYDLASGLGSLNGEKLTPLLLNTI
jgi:kumamolisin